MAVLGIAIAATDDFVPRMADRLESRRREASSKLDAQKKSAQSQYMTPYVVAQSMAALFRPQKFPEVRLLDAGAGIGSLTAAFVEAFCQRRNLVRRLTVTAYEMDSMLAGFLQDTCADCQQLSGHADIPFTAYLHTEDFLQAAAHQLMVGREPMQRFTHAILNPPYKKMHRDSPARHLLHSLGIEVGNLYAGFLAVAIKLLEPGGELVAITPRSFCNGPYFIAFRRLLLETMALRHLHVFASRKQAFKDDAVLQENVILYAVKQAPQERVTLSRGLDWAHSISREVEFTDVVHPQDPHCFLHLAVRQDEAHYSTRMQAMPCTLQDVGIAVSTGPVVDFRLKVYLRQELVTGSVALLYPAHCQHGFVVWPQVRGRKPNAIMDANAVQKCLYPNGYYTIVRRFSATEERRRVVAVVYDPHDVPGAQIGFENHLNVFHCRRQGLPRDLACGLAVYLNSTLVDRYFRQFNGHTQVNVGDLYALRYPHRETLQGLGERVRGRNFPSQEEIDGWLEGYECGATLDQQTPHPGTGEINQGDHDKNGGNQGE